MTHRAPISWMLAATALLPACNQASLPGCPAGTREVEGVCRVSCSADTDCLPSERCDASACVPRGGSEPPKILTFLVTPEIIRTPGELVQIEYLVEDATRVEIAPSVLAQTSELSKVLNVPVQNTTTFRLTASAPNGAMTSQERTVVLEGGSVGILSFTATPEMVRPTDPITLAWDVRNAVPGSIRITDPENNRSVMDAAAASGSTTDQAHNLPTEYWIEAQGMNGVTVRDSVRVLRVVEGDPSITRLEALPPLIKPLDTALIAWETRNATALDISEAGAPPYVVQELWDVQRGFRLVAPDATTTYSVTAQGQRGNVNGTVLVEVELAGAPKIEEADVDPLIRTQNQGNNSVEVTWNVTDARKVFLYSNEVLVAEVSSSGRRTLPTGPSNLAVRVVADKDGSVEEARRVAWYVVAEDEPNGSAGNADPVGDIGRFGTLLPLETDTFSLQASAGGSISARLQSRDATSCGDGLANVSFTLRDTNQMVPIATGQVGTDGCQVLEAHHLQNRVYFLELSRPGASADSVEYMVLADVFGPVCGDHVAEGEETCDDGNRLAGDGCDGYCTTEVPVQYDVTSNPPGAVPNPIAPPLPVTFSRIGQNGDRYAVLPLPFPFALFGRRYAGVVIHTSGYVAFRPEEETHGPTAAIPSPGAPNALIAPFWGDLTLADFSDAKGEVLVWGSNRGAADGRFTIAFRNLTGRTHTQGNRILLDAIVQLEETDNTVRILYGPVQVSGNPRNEDVVAGIEDEMGAVGYSVPGCAPTCRPSVLEASSVVFTPR